MSAHSVPRLAIIKSAPLVVAALIPQAVAAIAVLLAESSGIVGAAALIGVMASLVGLGMVIGVGVMICTTRDLMLARRAGEDRTAAFALNAGYATIFSAISLPVLALITMLFVFFDVAPAQIIWWLALTQVPVLLATPFNALLNGAFQAADRSGENLASAIIQGALTSIGAIVAFATDMFPSLLGSILVYGSIQALAVVGTLLWRTLRLRRKTGLTLQVKMSSNLSQLSERLLAALDAVVFVGIFLVAQTIAAGVSPATGDVVAVAVAFARAAAVPLKQVGITIARVELSKFGDGVVRSPWLWYVPLSAYPYLSFSVLAIIIYGLSGQAGQYWPFLTVLLFVQFLAEPWAGVLYSYAKVRFGAPVGIRGLILIYLILVPVGLWWLSVTGASPVGFMLLFAVARIAFAFSNIAAISRL